MNIGDRVKLLPGTNIFQANDSDIGTIISEERFFQDMIWHGVQFDRNISGHDCAIPIGKFGHCAWVPKKHLIKAPKILNITDWKNKQRQESVHHKYSVYKFIEETNERYKN